jgi:uncharacterized protein (DUF1697 family)
MTFIAFIRGINVGRAKPVSMSDLREVVESIGYKEVRTLLRSGNVVFSGEGTAADIAKALELAIDRRLRLHANVVVRTAAELHAVVEANPISEAEGDGSRLHVMFLDARLSADERAKVDAADFDTDVVRSVSREIYVWYRNGMSGSVTAARLGKLIKTTATDRNWNTVTRLLALARDRAMFGQ